VMAREAIAEACDYAWNPFEPDNQSNHYKRMIAHRDAIDAALAAPGGGHHKLDNERQVFFYEQDFYVLSNFSAFQVEFRGISFNTSEEAYHFQRFAGIDNDVRNRHVTALLRCRSAHDAFRYAQEHKADQRPDWDAVKVDEMRQILFAKAEQHEYVRRKLLATGDRELIEDSWRDDFWGWGPNRDGQNMLGKLWMEIRAELRKRPTPTQDGGDG